MHSRYDCFPVLSIGSQSLADRVHQEANKPHNYFCFWQQFVIQLVVEEFPPFPNDTVIGLHNPADFGDEAAQIGFQCC